MRPLLSKSSTDYVKLFHTLFFLLQGLTPIPMGKGQCVYISINKPQPTLLWCDMTRIILWFELNLCGDLK